MPTRAWAGYATVDDTLDGHVAAIAGSEAGTALAEAAAALAATLAAIARDGEGVVVRAEVVELDGGVRLPDLAAAAAVRLVDVGAVNRTTADDHRAAIGPDTGCLLALRRAAGSRPDATASVALADLADLGHEHGVPVTVLVGTGLLAVEPG